MPSSSAERVRKFRKVRRDAGLVELRIWVTKDDRDAVLDLAEPFVKEANWQWSNHVAFGPHWRTHPKVLWLAKIFGRNV